MDILSATSSLVDVVYPVLAAAAIAMARALGMIVITPAFVRLGLTGLIRSGVAIAIALPLIPGFMATFAEGQSFSSLVVTGLVFKELILGVILGVVLGIPFWAAEMAGDLVDLQRGSTSAQLVDPLQATETSIAGTFFVLALVALFFKSGGFSLLADTYYRSYEIWPVTSFSPALGTGAGFAVLGILDRVMQIGVLLIAPIVLALLIADLMLAYLSRMAPQFHVFDLSLAVKNLIFAILIVLYLTYLLQYMVAELALFKDAPAVLRDLLEPTPR
ncbi:type III secretion system export apparatus subunit SctT [Ciceribacter ferrooxidans]|uniref:EscT/YscT/HrcT family type III secretion system export apparatus protein n=1 Tax=Ciceribacter ferrooxidans TaxID=2509717 RepID=A0A4Q2U120_9HYPH|nr:type III secretion system export apparatus subunit SctT [Ciceribacter ferrooxidans]RYC27341.1 EscT/YscT/HrcT family type III secretion system export apparatus protein [Ciceribacter ferrooxidans]